MQRLRPRLGRWGHRFTLLDAAASGGMLMFTTFVLIPLAISFYVGFTDQNPVLLQDTSFIGVENYRELFGDEALHRALWNTAKLTIAVTIGANLGGLILAVILDGTSRYYRVLRTLVFVPQVLSAVVVSFIFFTILSNRGILNSVLGSLGLENLAQPWLGRPDVALWSIAAVVVWQMIGFTTVVYLAALQSVPDDLLEAATIDGAGGWKRFSRISFPLMSQGVTIAVTIVLITTLRLYDHVAVLTGGGPGFRTETAVFYLLRMGFTNNRTGYASAIAFVLLLIIGSVSAILVTLMRRREVQL